MSGKQTKTTAKKIQKSFGFKASPLYNINVTNKLSNKLKILRIMTKKEIIMSLDKNGKAKCELSTAESLLNDEFIVIDRYEDGVLYGFIFWDAIVEEVMDEDEMMVFLMAHSGLENWGEGYKIMKELCSKGYLVDLVEDEEDERCYAKENFDKVLSDFCNRCDKLNEEA